MNGAGSHSKSWRWRAAWRAAAGTVVLAGVLAGGPGACRDEVRQVVAAAEPTTTRAQDPDTAGRSFAHGLLETVLRRHVDEDGWVDYAGLSRDPAPLDAYLEAVATAPLDELDRNERLALLINAYNAFTLRLILDHYPVRSIKDIPAARRWKDRRWNVGGHVWSLDQIEHEQIRPKFDEPRIHFALVCAAVGCPILRNEAYAADRLEAQLEDQARAAHRDGRWFRYDAQDNVLYLTKLYDWYRGDFEQAAGSVTAYAAAYAPALEAALAAGRAPNVRWLDYDWALNDIPRNGR